MTEAIIGICLILGGFICCIAGLGILRLPDVYMRLHASTKAGTLGVGINLVAVILYSDNPSTTPIAFAIMIFIMVTAPVAAHMIARAVYKDKNEKIYKISPDDTPLS